MLSKDERNSIFTALMMGKLNPVECDLHDERDQFLIRHQPTGSTLMGSIVVYSTGGRPGPEIYSIGIGVGYDPVKAVERDNFDALLSTVKDWADAVVRWRDTPDLWQLRHGWKFLAEQRYEESSNTLFSPEEQDAISAQLTAIRESVKETYALTAEQEAKIDARFNEAEKAAGRLGRKDWILLFGGAVFSLILADVITPDIAQHILTIAVHGVQHLFTAAPRSIRAD